MQTQSELGKSRVIARVLLVLLVMLPLLAACAPPPEDPVTGVMCDWVTWIKAVGTALMVILLTGSIMIVAVAYAGAGIVWSGLYQFAQRLVNGAVVAILVLGVGVPAFWWIMESLGANTCSG
jgi:hypothetical protein